MIKPKYIMVLILLMLPCLTDSIYASSGELSEGTFKHRPLVAKASFSPLFRVLSAASIFLFSMVDASPFPRSAPSDPQPPSWLDFREIPNWGAVAYSRCAHESEWITITGDFRYADCVERELSLLYEQDAKRDDKVGAVAKYNLARFYAHDDCFKVEHVPCSFDKERELKKASAEAGYAPAQFDIGVALLKDTPQEAVDWLEKAARQGYSKAGDYLARAYLSPYSGIANNEDKALELYKLANNKDLGEALADFANFYRRGYILFPRDFIPPNREKQIVWLKRSADSGYSEAFYELALLSKEDEASQYKLAEEAAGLGSIKGKFLFSHLLLRANTHESLTQAKQLLESILQDSRSRRMDHSGIIAISKSIIPRYYHNDSIYNNAKILLSQTLTIVIYRTDCEDLNVRFKVF
jgi:TPR repeat protein